MKTYLKIAAILIFFLYGNLSFCQQWKWAVSAGAGSNVDVCFDIATDSRGNVYWVGTVMGTVAFGSNSVTSPTNTTMAVIAKYDSLGTPLWVRKISSALSGYDIWCTGISIDTANRIFITGSYMGTAHFD